MEQVVGTTPVEDVAVVDEVVGSQGQDRELTPDDVFTPGNSSEDFFRANSVESEEQPVEAALPEDTVPEPQEVAPQDSENETVRYQYWQSEADKARNENESLKQQLQQNQPQPAQAEADSKQEESYESFPPPPDKPAKPAGYNKEEAWSDPASTSAQHLEEVDKWRENMDEYNRLHTDYNVAVIAEERDKLIKERQDIQRKQAEKEAYDSNLTMIGDHLAKTYNASSDEIKNFVEVMDKPESVTVDNLFQLYRMRQTGVVNGQPEGGKEPIKSAESATPSNESFDQMKRAQQVPSPMGVLPSANKAASSSPEDGILDSMIGDYNKRNPWT